MKLFLPMLCVAGLITSSPIWAETTLPLSPQQIATLKASYALTDESAPLVYSGDPLTITLPIGKEKRLIFAEPIQAELNGKLTTDQLRIINNDRSLYLTAQQAFTTTRIYVTLKNSQKIILLDLVTNDQASTTTRSIVLKSTDKPLVSAEAKPNMSASIPENSTNSADDYVNAIRFAWQQLYAPERFRPEAVNFTRTPMHTDYFVSSLIYGDKVIAHPTASWFSNGLYVTVVQLRNKYPFATHIDIKHDLCGDWQAAALYPRAKLKPQGEPSGDSTTLFLISNLPFDKAMEICNGRA